MEKVNNQLQFNLSSEVGKGVYANLALITHSSSEFIVDFATMLPGLDKANVGARVILAPEHAKRFLMALQENISKYEQQFGRINVPVMGTPRTATPFGDGKGN
jgi:hypothetical protein